ncbi:MAG: T9SS type A sorting domain-containing protein, partial [Bacteroidales bacterium]|nr:T9SS type A sorting domain-containing protein [Bacteroidales bacterium]
NCEGMKIAVYNADGKLVKITEVTSGIIDLRPITPGLYTLVADTSNGKMSTLIIIR